MATVNLVKHRNDVYTIEHEGKTVKRIRRYILEGEIESDDALATRAQKDFDEYIQAEKDIKKTYVGEVVKTEQI